MQTLDMSKVIARISDAQSKSRFKKLVKRYEDAQWAFLDMDLAHRTCEMIRRRNASRQDGNLAEDDLLIDGALAARAFTLYWEATSRFTPKPALNGREWTRHLELRDIRSKVFAHREQYDHPSGPWLRGHTILEATGTQMRLGFWWVRRNFFGSAIVDLTTLSGRIKSYYNDQVLERREVMMDEFEKILAAGHFARCELESLQFDLSDAPASRRRTHLVIDGLVDLETPIAPDEVGPFKAALEEAKNERDRRLAGLPPKE